MRKMLKSSWSACLFAVSIGVVKADGNETAGAVVGPLISLAVIAICAICIYRRCCQRNEVVVVADRQPAAMAQAQQQIQIITPPTQYMPQPQPTYMAPGQGYPPPPHVYSAPPPPPPVYTEK